MDVAQSPASEQDRSAAEQARTQSGAFATTLDYVSNFYPLWFTYYQFQLGTANRLEPGYRADLLDGTAVERAHWDT